MLDRQSLDQLKQFRQDLRETLNQQEATVRGTPATFGFARLDDGKDAFLNPEQMQRVLPGDRVLVELSEDNKKRQVAKVVRLLESPHQQVVGFVTLRGQAWFLQTEIEQSQRRLFIPPNQRKGLKEGVYLRARIKQHPFKDGRSAVETMKVLGDQTRPGIYTDIALAREHLPGPPREPTRPAEVAAVEREDLSALPFVTIDDPQSRDLDDALYCEANDEGFLLRVAIADPSALFSAKDALDREACKRVQTLYFPDRNVSMLPESIACDRASLIAGEKRPALVCSLQINPNGEVQQGHFQRAEIQVAARHDYVSATEQLQNAADAAWQALAQCSMALRQQRGQSALLNPNQREYRILLDEQGAPAAMTAKTGGPAQDCVEEAMVAVNQFAAAFLQQAGAGLFIAHGGFRPDRLRQIGRILSEQLPDYTVGNLENFEDYLRLFRMLGEIEHPLPLRAIASRLLQRAQISQEARPHFGMGLRQYCTVTSPIRRYIDLHNHRAITAVLDGRRAPSLADDEVQRLQQRLQGGRQAQRFVQRWLACQYAQAHIGLEGEAEIVQTHGSGFVARMLDTGVEGQVDLGKLPEKFRFDGTYFRHVGEKAAFCLEQQIKVRVESCDMLAQSVSLQWIPESGSATESEK